MSIQTETSWVQYAGNNSAVTPYPVPFLFFENAHLKVIQTSSAGADTVLQLGTDYTVTGAGNPAGGSITTAAAWAAANKITIYRDPPFTQMVDYVNQDAFPAETHESALDKVTMLAQTLKRYYDRALKFPESVDATTLSDLPSPQALTVFGLDGASPPKARWMDSEEMRDFLSLPAPILNMPQAVWNDATERTGKVPDYTGQVGIQKSDNSQWVSTGTVAGNWRLLTSATVVRTEPELRTALAGGGTIILKGGTYTVAAALDITVASTRLIGDQGARIVVNNAVSGVNAINVKAGDVVIEGIEITGSQSLDSGIEHTAISIPRGVGNANAFRLKVRRCRIYNVNLGIHASGNVSSVELRGVEISNCWIHTFRHSGINLDWNFREIAVRDCIVEQYITGDAHTNGLGAGIKINNSANASVSGCMVRECRYWGIEFFLCTTSQAARNLIENCTNGISLGGKTHNSAVFNHIIGADGGVGGLEMVGQDHLALGNVITPGTKTIVVGIAVNAENGAPGTLPTKVHITGNVVRQAAAAVQLLSNSGKPTGIVDSFIQGNDFDCERAGVAGNAVWINNDGVNYVGRIKISNNLFRGASNAAVLSQHGFLIEVKGNTQLGALVAGETSGKCCFYINGDGSMLTEPDNALQSGQGYVRVGQNLRINPGSNQVVSQSEFRLGGVASVSAAYSVVSGVSTVLASASAPYTITLPDAAANPQRIIRVKLTTLGGNTVTVDSAGGTIDGGADVSSSTNYTRWAFFSDGTNWHVI